MISTEYSFGAQGTKVLLEKRFPGALLTLKPEKLRKFSGKRVH